jgi:hypothetical protein
VLLDGDDAIKVVIGGTNVVLIFIGISVEDSTYEVDEFTLAYTLVIFTLIDDVRGTDEPAIDVFCVAVGETADGEM